MRNALLAAVCLLLLGLCAFLSAQPQDDQATVKLQLLDAETGKGVGGIVRFFRTGSKEPLTLAGLYDRLKGLQRRDDSAGWYVVPAGGAEVRLPRAELRAEALSGLETTLTRLDLDLTGKARAEVTLKLRYLFRPEKE